MSNLRQAAQQALEALVAAYQGKDKTGQVTEAIAALRAALAESEKPVELSDGFEAWWTKHRVKRVLNPAGVARMVWEAAARHHRKVAAPTPRKPLTDLELRAVFILTNTAEPLAEGWPGLERFARAIERAHGIGEQA